MEFKKYSPSKNLEHIVAYYWTLKSSELDVTSDTYRFVPDGYVDWVFHLGNSWQCDFPHLTTQNKTSAFHIFGQLKSYINLSLPSDNLNVFAVKFHPWVANKIWNVDMHYLTNSCLSIEDLDLPFVAMLQEQICTSNSVLKRISLVEKYITSLSLNDIDVSLKHIFQQLHNNTNKLDLKSINVGMRRIEQRFKSEIGISPKLLYQTNRINSVIDKMKANSYESLTQLALDYNFYDQSHFIRDFKKFTGFNPTKFLKSINPDGDILNLRVS